MKCSCGLLSADAAAGQREWVDVRWRREPLVSNKACQTRVVLRKRVGECPREADDNKQRQTRSCKAKQSNRHAPSDCESRYQVLEKSQRRVVC